MKTYWPLLIPVGSICFLLVVVFFVFISIAKEREQLRQITPPPAAFTEEAQLLYDAAFLESLRGLAARDGSARYERNDGLVARAHAIALDVVRTRAERLPGLEASGK